MRRNLVIAASFMAMLLSIGSSAKALETEIIYTGSLTDFSDPSGNTFGENGTNPIGSGFVATFYIDTNLGVLGDVNGFTNNYITGGPSYSDVSPVFATLELLPGGNETKTFTAYPSGYGNSILEFPTTGQYQTSDAGLVGSDVTEENFGGGGSIAVYGNCTYCALPVTFGEAFDVSLYFGGGGFDLPGGANGEFDVVSASSPGIVNFTSAAPEPSTWLLMIAGVGVVGAVLRRRGRHATLPLPITASA